MLNEHGLEVKLEQSMKMLSFRYDYEDLLPKQSAERHGVDLYVTFYTHLHNAAQVLTSVSLLLV